MKQAIVERLDLPALVDGRENLDIAEPYKAIKWAMARARELRLQGENVRVIVYVPHPCISGWLKMETRFEQHE